MIQKFTLFFLVLLLPGPVSFAQPVIMLREDFTQVPIGPATRYRVDSTTRLTLPDLLHDAAPAAWRALAGEPNFGDNPYPHWLRFEVENAGNGRRKVVLLTKGLDSLRAYLTAGDSLLKTFPPTGSHVPVYQRERPGAYLSLSFELPPRARRTLWMRIRNVHYRLTASPFGLYEQKQAARLLHGHAFFQSLYIGGMFVILMFSVVLLLLFRERIYAFYLGCVLCSAGIMLCYNDYYYLIFATAPGVIVNKNLYGILSALVPVFYLLFAENFLHISQLRDKSLIRASRLVVGLQLALLAGFLLAGQPLFRHRLVFYLTMSALSIISLLYVYRSIRRHYMPAWLFLGASVPVILTVMLETFSGWHHIPVQDIHGYFYSATLFEMFMLTCGIAYRLKLDQDQKKGLQKEIMQEQIKAQEMVKARIGADLHDVIGSQLGAAKMHVDLLRYKHFPEASYDYWAPVYNVLQLSIDNVRNIAHQMTSLNFEGAGLVSTLEKIYGYIEKPAISFQSTGMEQRLDRFTEMVLYAVINEAINNTLKHAQATRVDVQIIREAYAVTVIVEDDGVGFDLQKLGMHGQGIRNMETRVRNYLKGELSIDTHLNGGTIIIIKVRL